MVVVELQLQVVGLQVGQDEDAGTVPGNFPKRSKMYWAMIDTHSLNSSVDLCALPHPGALLPGTGRVRMERSSRTELPFGEGFDGGPHVRIVGWAVPGEDAR